MIEVRLRDGRTTYYFEDAAELRALLHDRPGHKPRGNEPVMVEGTYLIGEHQRPFKAALRYLNRHVIAVVEEPIEGETTPQAAA